LEGGGDLNRLQDFGIPEQRRLLNLILHSDFGDYEFGGYMRECYSPVLRGFCAMNMQVIINEKHECNQTLEPDLDDFDGRVQVGSTLNSIVNQP
jgi:hypothetical protein